ncbi:MAG: S8 family peptidase [Bdellovibrionales bacterium]
MKRILKLMMSVSVAFFAQLAQAQVDQYLVVYKEQNARQLRSLQGSDLQKYLRQQTQNNERQLLQSLRSQSRTQNRMASLWILNSTILEADSQVAREVQNLPYVRKVFLLDRRAELIQPAPGQQLAQDTSDFTYGLIKIGVPDVRNQFPQISGANVRVGILDTGIDANHPDLKGKVVMYRNFMDGGGQNPMDDHGHGTHVAGTIAGGNASGRSIGVAPQSKLYIGRIIGRSGAATEANILLSLQWMADPDGNPETQDAVHVVSNSWGFGGAFNSRDPQDDPHCAVLNRLRVMNVLPVFAAGNEGPSAASLRVPGACPDSFTVGATDAKDSIARFSSRGPAKWKTVELPKPDITAPGVNTISAKPGGGYQPMSGTSMATPHVAGVVALIKQARPQLNQAQIQEVIQRTSVDKGAPGYDQIFGHGRADVLGAIKALSNSQGNR